MGEGRPGGLVSGPPHTHTRARKFDLNGNVSVSTLVSHAHASVHAEWGPSVMGRVKLTDIRPTARSSGQSVGFRDRQIGRQSPKLHSAAPGQREALGAQEGGNYC